MSKEKSAQGESKLNSIDETSSDKVNVQGTNSPISNNQNIEVSNSSPDTTKKLVNFFMAVIPKIISAISLLAVLGFLADLTGLLGFFGVDFSRLLSRNQLIYAVDIIHTNGCGSSPILLPAELDPNHNPEEAASYVQSLMNDAPSLNLQTVVNASLFAFRVTGLSDQNGRIEISNRALVTVTQEALSQEMVEAVIVNRITGCGTGWIRRYEPAIKLGSHPSELIPVESPDADFFTLEEQESEIFYLETQCSGLGQFQIEMSIPVQTRIGSNTVMLKDSVQRICPKAFNLWNFSNSSLKLLASYVWNGEQYELVHDK